MANPAMKCTDKYRLECADCTISTGRPITQVAMEIGVNVKTLQRWVQKQRAQLDGALPTKAEDAEIKALKKRIRELEMENEFLKSRSLLRKRAGVKARYQLMLAEKGNYPMRMMARILEVSRSGFYA